MVRAHAEGGSIRTADMSEETRRSSLRLLYMPDQNANMRAASSCRHAPTVTARSKWPSTHLTEHCYHRLSACSFDDLVTSQCQSHARPVLSQTALHPVRTPDRPTSTGTTVQSALDPGRPDLLRPSGRLSALCPSAPPSGGAPPIRHCTAHRSTGSVAIGGDRTIVRRRDRLCARQA